MSEKSSPSAARKAPWPDWLRRGIELSQHCAARMVRLRATGMAAELTYRTLFALIPLTVLGLVLFQIVGGLEGVRSNVENQLFRFFGVPDVMYGEPSPMPEASSAKLNIPVLRKEANDSQIASARLGVPKPGDRVDFAALAGNNLVDSGNVLESPATVETTQAEERRLQASIRNTLRDLTDKVTNLDFASLGVAGLLLFIYAAVGLTDSVEADFNLVCESTRHRPWHLRMAIHWAILTIGSGLLAMSLYVSQLFIDWLAGHGGNTIFVTTLGNLLGFSAGWILLFLMYALMPNTKIYTPAAIAGSLVAAILWEVAKRGFQIYVATTQPYANLYGSLGLLPLFLFWIYITWLIVLFGLFLTYSWQAYPGHPPTPEQDRMEANIVPNSIWSVAALVAIGRAFQTGKPIDLPELTEVLHLPHGVVRKLTQELESLDFVMRSTHSGREKFTLSRPTSRILISDLLRDLTEPPAMTGEQESNAWQAFSKLQAICSDATNRMTLDDLISA